MVKLKYLVDQPSGVMGGEWRCPFKNLRRDWCTEHQLHKERKEDLRRYESQFEQVKLSH